MDRRLLLASGAYIDLSEYLLKSEAETLYAPLDAILNKQDKLISGTNIKTVNGNSLLGGGDITISGGGDYLPLTGGTITGDLTLTGGAGGRGNFQAYSTLSSEVWSNIYYLSHNGDHAIRMGDNKVEIINDVERTKSSIDWSGDGTKFLSDDGTYKTISSSSGGSGAYSEVNHGTSDTTFTLTPNTFHVWDEVVNLTLTLGSETTGVANEYLFQFTSGSEPTTLSLPDDIKWANELVIEPNMIYQVSILKGLASVLEFDNAPKLNLIENHITYDEGSFMDSGMITFEYPTASELIFAMGKYASSMLVVPQGSTQIRIAWYEPTAPIIKSFSPTEDSTYKYIL